MNMGGKEEERVVSFRLEERELRVTKRGGGERELREENPTVLLFFFPYLSLSISP